MTSKCVQCHNATMIRWWLFGDSGKLRCSKHMEGGENMAKKTIKKKKKKGNY